MRQETKTKAQKKAEDLRRVRRALEYARIEDLQIAAAQSAPSPCYDRMVHQIFDRIDRNGDGLIDAVDLGRQFKSIGHQYSRRCVSTACPQSKSRAFTLCRACGSVADAIRQLLQIIFEGDDSGRGAIE